MENSSCAAACHFLVLQEACGINLFLKFLAWSVSVLQILLPCSCKSCNCICNCNCNCNHSSAEKVTQTPVITTDKEEIERRNKDQDDEKELTQEDIKTVMRNIGFNLDQENNMAIGNDSIARIFDDDEPSLQEVRQAFLVFDHNNNGYFDALDLQRVLKSLGLGEGVGMDECEQMIAKYDTNKDGKIDVAEFTKVLESGIC